MKYEITTDKWDLYCMRIAKMVASKSNCSSRNIGAVLVRPNKSIVSTGMNGSPMGITHCNERFLDRTTGKPNPDKLLKFFEDVASESDKSHLLNNRDMPVILGEKMNYLEQRLKGTCSYHPCPRKWLGFESGQGLSLCNAGHAERNALILAARNGSVTENCTLYCYCGVPCKECVIEIINAGISRLVFLEKDYIYDKYSTVLLKESGIKCDVVLEEDINERGECCGNR